MDRIEGWGGVWDEWRWEMSGLLKREWKRKQIRIALPLWYVKLYSIL
jgi:hypothetical protein